jgi:beta-galactosidase
MEDLAGSLGLDVPALSNYSPPKGRGYDAWRARMALSHRSTVGYSYTSWAGNVVRDDANLVNYVLAAKGGRGPNVEENWSLDWVEPECASASVPVYHALLGIACGATGIDVYTACATAEWGEHLRIEMEPPYGGAAPIGVEGQAGPSLPALRVLTHFLVGVGPDLMRARLEPGTTFCTYAPYAALSAWNPAAGSRVPSLETSLVPFVRDCLARNRPFRLGDLADPLPDGPVMMAGGFFLARDVQLRLAEHVRGGRELLVLGELPELDEHFQPCRILADAVGGVTGELPEPVKGSGHLEFRFVGPGERDAFVFLFSRTDEARTVTASAGGVSLTVDLAPRGCAAVRITDGRLAACFVKGLQERTGEGIAVRVLVGADRVESGEACDLSGIRLGGGWDLRTHGRQS